jgi:AhpD family alkylhydroperoxidase
MQAHRGVIRAGLVVLGLSQLLIGLWALVDTAGWFGSFPGPFASDWLPAYGGYNEHLAVDAGAFFAATGVMLLLAAAWMERRLVQAALIAYLVFQVPHTVYHLGADDVLPTGDRIASDVALGSTLVVAALLLWLAGRSEQRPARSSAASGNGVARIAPKNTGLLARFGSWYARRQYGGEVTPGGVFAHHPKLAIGYATMELTVERSRTVDEKLKYLGEIRAAQVVNCEWCMDFGSKLGRESGVTDEQLLEMARYRESDAFDPLEKLVLDYATAMSRSPAAVDDAMFARLAEHFDEPQLVELTTAIAIENFRARFNHATGMAPQGFSEGMVCVVPETAPLSSAPVR